MGVELLGIVASFATIVSGFGWLMDRNSKRTEQLLHSTNHSIQKIATEVDTLSQGLTELRITLPTNFVTKNELLMHIQGEERWHEKTTERLREIQEEILSLRYHSSSSNGHH